MPKNLELLKKYFDPNPKFLILNRPIIEIIASFLKVKKLGKDEDLIKSLMDEETGKLKQDIVSSRNIIKSKEKYQKIDYDDLISQTKDPVEEIYSYFEIPKFEHRYTDLEQLSYNNVKYNDDVLEYNLHTIRTDKIEKEKIILENYFNKETIDRMKGYDIYA